MIILRGRSDLLSSQKAGTTVSPAAGLHFMHRHLVILSEILQMLIELDGPFGM